MNLITSFGTLSIHLCSLFISNFDLAKKAAVKALDCCPVDTIRRFINCSFLFMSAYRKGLTGKAAVWAVKKQPSHHTISKSARIAIESLLN
jgi:hypothetical protein